MALNSVTFYKMFLSGYMGSFGPAIVYFVAPTRWITYFLSDAFDVRML